MRIRWLILLTTILGLAVGGAAYANGLVADNATGASSGAGSTGDHQNVLPTPVPDVPKEKPGVYPYNQPPRAPNPANSAPARSRTYVAPSNQGPVTGYGPGGMGAPPGAPANPPYSYGGTGAPR